MKWRPAILPVVLLLGWAIFSQSRIINSILLPSPLKVIKLVLCWNELLQLWVDLFHTCRRLFIGFAIGSIIGVAVGIAMGRSKKLYEMVEFLVDFFRSIPVAALFPVFIVFFGIGEVSKVVTVIWSSSLIVVVNTMYGVRECSKIRQDFVRTLHPNSLQMLTTVVIPEAVPTIIAGLRLGVSIGLIVVILTEMYFTCTVGLGYRIYNASMVYNTPEMLFALGVTGVLGYGLNQIFVWAERYFQRWKDPIIKTR